ncbi:MAG: DUF3726 domain-containing protein [Hyphomicrobiales bacterium]|nr:DUF3726 domain-containing protein [Hyphomicrobiales bacterium]
MIVSFNEVETTILKAARGAGMEWGLAEEAAQAARFLARFRLPFETPFLHLFSTRAWEATPVLEGARLRSGRADGWLCPIRAGAYLSDLGEACVTRLERLVSPLLILPFASRAMAKTDVAWNEVRLRVGPLGIMLVSGEVRALAASQAEEVSLSSFEGGWTGAWTHEGSAGGAVIEDASWARLQEYEALTYVPASAKSRSSGAGAGAIDND